VIELLETNNTRLSATPSIPIGADLRVTPLGAPSTVIRGTPFTITDTTRNDGGAAAASTTSYYLSANNTLDASDVLLGSHGVGTLATGGLENGQATVVIPVTQAIGNYYIIAKTDSANIVVEAIETNNTISKSIRVN